MEAGGWGEWCVTEDAEVSLRILARGYSAVFVERVFGRQPTDTPMPSGGAN